MKKILSFLAAGALALGLIGCSGDLHDDEFNPIDTSKFETFELCGAMTDWKNDAGTNLKFTPTENAYEYSVTFTAKDAEQGFCFITKTGLWDDYQIGGESMKAGTLPEGISFSSKAGEGKHEDAIFSGLTKDAAYKMTVETSSGVYVVSLASTEAPVAPADPVPFYLDGFYISGDMNEWAGSMDTLLWSPTLDKDTGILTYKYDFAATKEAHLFGIRNNTSDWKVKYIDGVFAFGTDTNYVSVVKNGKDNNKITGLTLGNNYRIYVQTTPEKEVSFKVVVLNKATINVNVTGLPDEANGKVMYLTGDYFGWNEPGDDNSSIKGTVADGAVSYSFDYIYEGTTFELQVQGKAGSKGWTKPEISGPDGQNASFTVTHEKTTVTVTYVETKEITSTDTSTEKDWGLQYRCKWDVK